MSGGAKAMYAAVMVTDGGKDKWVTGTGTGDFSKEEARAYIAKEIEQGRALWGYVAKITQRLSRTVKCEEM